MYEYVKGELVEVSPAEAIVEASGVGYKLLISLSTFSELQSRVGQTVKLYSYHQVREDDEALYGFADKAERAVFIHLVSVGGVGPGSARMILSSMTADEATSAILGGDVGRFKAVKGIGLKTAQRIILELKDKVGKGGGLSLQGAAASEQSAVREEALSALVLLGFSKPNVEKVLSSLLKEDPSLTLEEVIKKSLKAL